MPAFRARFQKWLAVHRREQERQIDELQRPPARYRERLLAMESSTSELST